MHALLETPSSRETSLSMFVSYYIEKKTVHSLANVVFSQSSKAA